MSGLVSELPQLFGKHARTHADFLNGQQSAASPSGTGPQAQVVTPIVLPAPLPRQAEDVKEPDPNALNYEAVPLSPVHQGSTLESTWDVAKKSIKKVLSIAFVVASICLAIFGAIAIAGIIAFSAGSLTFFAAAMVAPVITAVGTPLTCIFASVIFVGGLTLSTYSLLEILKKKIEDEAVQKEDEDDQPVAEEGASPSDDAPISTSQDAAPGPAMSASRSQPSGSVSKSAEVGGPIPMASASGPAMSASPSQPPRSVPVSVGTPSASASASASPAASQKSPAPPQRVLESVTSK